MIYSLKGILKTILPPNKVLLQCSFITFEIIVPYTQIETFFKNKQGKEIEIFISTIIKRGERIFLYGFREKIERELFEKLINLSKIGPNLALNLISTFSPEELKKIVANEDVKALVKVPGIGLKRAEKVFIELKSIFGAYEKKDIKLSAKSKEIFEEGVHCLMNLGLTRKEAEKIIFEVFSSEEDLESLIKKALKKLSPI